MASKRDFEQTAAIIRAARLAVATTAPVEVHLLNEDDVWQVLEDMERAFASYFAREHASFNIHRFYAGCHGYGATHETT